MSPLIPLWVKSNKSKSAPTIFTSTLFTWSSCTQIRSVSSPDPNRERSLLKLQLFLQTTSVWFLQLWPEHWTHTIRVEMNRDLRSADFTWYRSALWLFPLYLCIKLRRDFSVFPINPSWQRQQCRKSDKEINVVPTWCWNDQGVCCDWQRWCVGEVNWGQCGLLTYSICTYVTVPFCFSSFHSDSGQSGWQETPERWTFWNNAVHSQADEGDSVILTTIPNTPIFLPREFWF